MGQPAIEPGNGGNEVVDQGFGYLNNQNQDQAFNQQGQGQEEVKINPAWNNLLSRVPEGLHGQILPELKQWDQNYQQGLQKVHSQYAGYKPFLDQQIDPNALNEGYLIRQALENDPMAVVQAMIQHYQLQLPTEQGQGNPDETVEDEGLPYDLSQDPEFNRYRQMTETMANALITQHQQAQEAQEDADLDQLMSAAANKFGQNWNEEWILQHLMYSGVDTVTPEILDQAQEAYTQHVQNIVQNYRSPSQSAPVLMGGGGGVPSQQTPVGNMSGKDRRALIVQTLQNLNANSGG